MPWPGPMDGVGAVMKNAIDQAIAYNPDEVIDLAKDILRFIGPTDVKLFTFSKEDIKEQANLIPTDL